MPPGGNFIAEAKMLSSSVGHDFWSVTFNFDIAPIRVYKISLRELQERLRLFCGGDRDVRREARRFLRVSCFKK